MYRNWYINFNLFSWHFFSFAFLYMLLYTFLYSIYSRFKPNIPGFLNAFKPGLTGLKTGALAYPGFGYPGIHGLHSLLPAIDS